MRQDELSSLIRRASEISSETEDLLANDPELLRIAHSAEEAGLPREAILQALRERIAERSNLLSPEQIVLATSVDGIAYPALVKEIDGTTVKVRFMQGGEALLQTHQVQPFSAVPGAKFQFFTPALGVWATGKLTRFNEDSRTATFDCWGSEYTVPLEKVRLNVSDQGGLVRLSHPRVIAVLFAIAVVAALVSFVVIRLILKSKGI